MVHQISNRHIQAVMNNLKFISLDYLAANKSGILDWRRDHSVGRKCLPIILPSTIRSGIMLYTPHAHSTLRLKLWCGGVPWALCSTWHAMPMCGAIIVSTISRMLRAVAAVVIVILNVRWWSWARMFCFWKLPNLS